MRTWRPTNGERPWPNSTKSPFLRLPCAYSGMALRRGVTTALIQWWKGRDSNPRPRHYEPGRRIGLSPLNTRYLIVGTSFYYGSAGRDGVAAIWAPKSTVGHRRITRNSRGLVQPGEVFLGTCSKTFLKRETYPTITTATSSCSPPEGRRTQAVSESAAFTTEPLVARAQIRSAVTYLVNPSVARSSRPPRSSAWNSTGNASPDPISGFLR